MKRVLAWTGGALLALVVLAGTAHATTSAEAHKHGGCIVCHLHHHLYSMFVE